MPHHKNTLVVRLQQHHDAGESHEQTRLLVEHIEGHLDDLASIAGTDSGAAKHIEQFRADLKEHFGVLLAHQAHG